MPAHMSGRYLSDAGDEGGTIYEKDKIHPGIYSRKMG